MPFLFPNYLFKRYMPLVTSRNVVREGNVLSPVCVCSHLYLLTSGRLVFDWKAFSFSGYLLCAIISGHNKWALKAGTPWPYSKLLHFTNEESKVMMKTPNAKEISLYEKSGWPRHRENRENREFGSYFFQTGKTQGILLWHREKFWDTGKIFFCDTGKNLDTGKIFDCDY